MSRGPSVSSNGWLRPCVLEIQPKQWQLLMNTPVLALPASGPAQQPIFSNKWTRKKKPPTPFAAADLPFEALGFMHTLPAKEEVQKGLASPFFPAFVQAAIFFEDGTCCFVNTTQLRAMWKTFSNRLVHSEEKALRPEERRGRQQYGRQRSFRDLGAYIRSSRALLEHVVHQGPSDVVCLAQLRLLEIKEEQSPVNKNSKTSLAWGLGSEQHLILLSLDDWRKICSVLFVEGGYLQKS